MATAMAGKTFIPCRVSDPASQVTLRSVPGEEEVSALFDSKMGFVAIIPAGLYRCETVVDGVVVRSDTYRVEDSTGECWSPVLIHNSTNVNFMTIYVYNFLYMTL